jgi:hypothetical protein
MAACEYYELTFWRVREPKSDKPLHNNITKVKKEQKFHNR